ncbi:MAG TPA: hypothetical protein DCG47_02735 [Spirochaetaceae bacterium]|nr:hypothetical protein [Spirochaetaceae bacterium]
MGIKQKGRTLTLALGIGAAAVIAALLIWLFSVPGTRGLYRWGYAAPFLAFIGLGLFAPALALGLVALQRSRPASGGAFKRLRLFSRSVSIVALLAGLGAGAFILSNAYGPRAPAELRPTLPDPGKDLTHPAGRLLRVALSSDPHVDRDISNHAARAAILSRAQAEYEGGELDAFFILGDFVEQGFLASGWERALGELRELAPSLPFYMLLGNHDAMLGGSRRWLAAMAPTNYARHSPYMWRLDAGRIHFLALDLPWGPEDLSHREKAWLETQLSGIAAEDITIVLSHAFFYSSGYVDEGTGKAWYDHEDNLRLIAPLLAGRADHLISGHNHYMEWIESGGTAWAVIGAMGGKPDPEPSYRSPGSQWFARERYGRLVLEELPEGLRCAFESHEGERLFERVIAYR